MAFTKLLISVGSQRRSEQCHRLFSDVSTKHIQTDSKFKHPAHNRFECLAHINNYNNILQNISDIYVRRSKKNKIKDPRKKKQGGEYKLKHAPGRWNLQQLKPSVLFFILRDRVVTDRRGCGGKACNRAVLVSYSRTHCQFVLWDLICFAVHLTAYSFF